MKKHFLLSIILFFGISIFAQDVPAEQRTLITKISATWCIPCGEWGWDLFKDLIDENEDKAVLIVAHHSGELESSTAEDITSNFSIFNQPVFLSNNTNQNNIFGDASLIRNEIKNIVDSSFLTTPIANAGMDLTLVGTQLQVAIKSKFFQDADGEFYIAAYVVESKIEQEQAGIGIAFHEKVLRAAVTSTTFGDLLVDGNVTANTEFDNTYSMTLDSEWSTSNIEIITIIWKKVNDTYQVVNTNISSDFVTSVASVDVLLQEASLKVFPTITATSATVSVEVKETLENASLGLYDLNGRKVVDVFQGNIKTDNNTFTINKKMVNANGIYFLVLKSNDKIASQKVIFE